MGNRQPANRLHKHKGPLWSFVEVTSFLAMTSGVFNITAFQHYNFATKSKPQLLIHFPCPLLLLFILVTIHHNAHPVFRRIKINISFDT